MRTMTRTAAAVLIAVGLLAGATGPAAAAPRTASGWHLLPPAHRWGPWYPLPPAHHWGVKSRTAGRG